MEIKPLVTVVTVTFQAENNIETTVKSVIHQNYENIEYLIIDGGSKDKTLDIVNKYRDKIKCCISEKDKGIYDAMNKGVSISKGEWIIFLNSGDTFFDCNVIKNIVNEISENTDIFYGNCEKMFSTFSRLQEAGDYRQLLIRPIFWHQSVCTKTDLLKNYPFDLRYRIAADYDFFVKMISQKKIFYKSNLYISRVLADGYSNENRFRSFFERWKIVSVNKRSIFLNIHYVFELLNMSSRELLKKIIPKSIIARIVANKKSSV